MSEYKFDYRLLQLPHVFNIKANMDIMCKGAIFAQIHGEEWKINMILEIVDYLNGLCKNEFTYDKNKYLIIIIIIKHNGNFTSVILNTQKEISPIYGQFIGHLGHDVPVTTKLNLYLSLYVSAIGTIFSSFFSLR